MDLLDAFVFTSAIVIAMFVLIGQLLKILDKEE
jgi:hypothetical protein